ncbi:hypothetical protein GGR54DRAFT_611901 [Hypoxylon sp. NC1633]|nr:hypothetical protein GGR54DRAFT_611901 [Hypoxylon sp. NC1633]
MQQGTDDKAKDWALTTGHGYILSRARRHAAASRLNLQHYLWKAALDNQNIHPSIRARLPENPVVADVAAGTCAWLLDVARELGPGAELHGLDYDLDQAPHPSTHPRNVRTRRWDVFDAVPDDLVGRFDYVHTRLLVLVVRDGDPRPVIRGLRALLKPGGFLQWDELDTVHQRVNRAASEPEQKTPALDQLGEWTRAGGRHDWTVRLAEVLAEEGFVDAAAHFVGDPPELARAFSEQHLLTAEEFAEGLAKLGNDEAAQKYFRIVEEAYQESVDGGSLSVPRVICVAQKPS